MENELYNFINNFNKEELSEEEYRRKQIKKQIFEYEAIIKHVNIYIVEIKSRINRLYKMLDK